LLAMDHFAAQLEELKRDRAILRELAKTKDKTIENQLNQISQQQQEHSKQLLTLRSIYET
jgi:hypothetical protein